MRPPPPRYSIYPVKGQPDVYELFDNRFGRWVFRGSYADVNGKRLALSSLHLAEQSAALTPSPSQRSNP